MAGTAIAYFTTTGTGSSTREDGLGAQPSRRSRPPRRRRVERSPSPGAPSHLPGPAAVTYKVERDGGGASGTCASTSVRDELCRQRPRSRHLHLRGDREVALLDGGQREQSGDRHRRPRGPLRARGRLVHSDRRRRRQPDDHGKGRRRRHGHHLHRRQEPHLRRRLGEPDGNVPTVSDSSGADVAFGSPTAIDFSAGVATVTAGKNGAMKLYKSGATSISVSDGSISTETPLAVTVSGAAASKFAARGRHHHADGGRSRQPHDHRPGRLRQRRAPPTPAPRASPSPAPRRAPAATMPTVVNSSGTAINFGSATAITFTAGVATVSSGKNGVMKLYKSGAAEHHRQRRHAHDQSAAGGDRIARRGIEIRAHGDHDHARRGRRRQPHDHRPGRLRQRRDLLRRRARASPSAAPRRAPTEPRPPSPTPPAPTSPSAASPRSTSAPAWPRSAASKNGAMKLYKIGSTSLKASDGTLTTPTALTVTVARHRLTARCSPPPRRA